MREVKSGPTRIKFKIYVNIDVIFLILLHLFNNIYNTRLRVIKNLLDGI